MKRLGWLLAVAGLVLAAALFARTNVRDIVDLVVAAGFGLLGAALFHVVPMTVNAVAWQALLPSSPRVHLRTLTWAIWLRESVNGLLPVARIGGEAVAYRIARRHGARDSDVAASLVADMALSILSQVAFTLFGLALLLASHRTSSAAMELIIAVGWLLPLGAAFMWVQRASVLSDVVRFLDRVLVGRLRSVLHSSLRLDESLRSIHVRKRDVRACFAWQLAGWIIGSGEIWLALYFLGRTPGILDAVAIEAFVQAAASAAFVMPAALGIQEGAFVLIGAALGFDATTALALATARRLRDVVIFFPGLIAWQWTERRNHDARRIRARELP